MILVMQKHVYIYYKK